MKLNNFFFSFLITALLFSFVACARNSTGANAKSDIKLNTSTESSGKSATDSSAHLSDMDIKNIMQTIDSRVTKVKQIINYNYYKDYYDRDIIAFRYFDRDVNQDSSTMYHLYYDEQGKLIYAEITHYRGALYNSYFHNDELLHVKVGPFIDGGPYINGDMTNVKSVIKKDPSYTFVRKDISLILEHAYK